MVGQPATFYLFLRNKKLIGFSDDCFSQSKKNLHIIECIAIFFKIEIIDKTFNRPDVTSLRRLKNYSSIANIPHKQYIVSQNVIPYNIFEFY